VVDDLDDSKFEDVEISDDSASDEGLDEDKSEVPEGHDFEIGSKTFFAILYEIRHQMDLSVNHHDSMMIRTGFVFAFASVLFVALITMSDHGRVWCLSVFLTFMCCFVCIVTILHGKSWRIPLGAKMEDIFELYGRFDYGGVSNLILDEKLTAYYKVIYATTRIKILVMAQAILLFAGLAISLIMEVMV